MNAIIQKKLMVVAAGIWLIYLVIHMLANLRYFSGKVAFNGFYNWFNNSTIIFYVVSALLLIGLLFHVYTAASRQLDSNKKRTIAYKKPYPEAIPRLVAWAGAFVLLGFIVWHVFQMLVLADDSDLYGALHSIFKEPSLMWLIYALGLFALTAHLHHGLDNIAQTFGLTHRQNQFAVALALVLLIGGFASVPIKIAISG